MTQPDEAFTPSRRPRRGQAQGQDAYSDAEIARGSTDALVGALGRMQLRLNVLAREQADALGRIEAKVDALQQTIDELTVLEEPVEPELEPEPESGPSAAGDLG
jgi:hypothetical protein